MRTDRLPLLATLFLPMLAGCAADAPPVSPEILAHVDHILVAEDARRVEDPALWEALDHTDPMVRLFGFRALGRMGDDAMLKALFVRVADEPDRRVRQEAMHALSLCRSPKMVDAAEGFILDPDPEIRAELCRGLGLSGDDRAVLPLLDLFSDPGSSVRVEAALALARLASNRSDPLAGRPPGAFSSLVDGVTRDPSPSVRWSTAYALGRLMNDAFSPALLAATKDKDPQVRTFAFEALGRVESPSPALLKAFASGVGDDSWLAAVEAAKGLARGAQLSGARALVSTLGPDGHPSIHVRSAACASLARYGEFEMVAVALNDAMSDPSQSVRAAALLSLAAIAPVETTLAAMRGLIDDGASPWMRGQIAGAAAVLPMEAGFGVVRGLFEDESPGVRAAALSVLPSFPTKGGAVAGYIRPALLEKDGAVRDAAAQVVLATKNQELVEDVRNALDDSDGADFIEARITLLRTLVELCQEEAATDLRRFLTDPESAVRAVCREELARLGQLIPNLPLPPAPPRPLVVDVARDVFRDEYPRVELETSIGPVVLELFTDQAPTHAALFMKRCREGFYDGLSFHRLVPGFVLQGLDPRGDGYGTGGTSLRAEVNRNRYDYGTIGMPDAGFDTGGCQVFVTFRPQPRLDDRYTLFGRVVEGMDLVERLDVGDVVIRATVE